MDIELQIKSLIFSFIFGFLFAFVISFFYKLIYSKNKIIRLLASLILVFVGVIIYFVCLRKINDATFHIYEILSIIVGYSLETILINRTCKKK